MTLTVPTANHSVKLAFYKHIHKNKVKKTILLQMVAIEEGILH